VLVCVPTVVEVAAVATMVVAAVAAVAAVIIHLNYYEAISVGKHSNKLIEIKIELKLLSSSSSLLLLLSPVLTFETEEWSYPT
jgi:hypothetical protein